MKVSEMLLRRILKKTIRDRESNINIQPFCQINEFHMGEFLNEMTGRVT